MLEQPHQALMLNVGLKPKPEANPQVKSDLAQIVKQKAPKIRRTIQVSEATETGQPTQQ